ncbi:MAG: ABC transporter substrate-binding protein [Alphaproteobacteria bacterium]|nr:ABC transporter substrate-binding protein [Alphaproteobacteria bacterium]MCW5740598.1 ABC transporter substrate-binding protein [Alphaproteobacteria bacterium]
MRRRELISLLGGVVSARPFAVSAQRPAMPVVGLLRSTPAEPFNDLLVALRLGLNDTGFVEGQDVAIEQRWADNQLDRLPHLALDLVRHRAAVIVGNLQAVRAAKAAAPNTPIVFVVGEDPVAAGLVESLGRPGGNLTGVTFFGGSELNAKRMELLRELVPKATTVAVFGDSSFSAFDAGLPGIEAAARAMGMRIVVIRLARSTELEAAFAKVAQAKADALLVSGSPLFTSERTTIVALAARHAIPAVYDLRSMVTAGGLISYSSSFTDAYRQAGAYAGRILKGAKPSELPVQQPTTFELAINLKTAKTLGLTVPVSLQIAATEVIE